MSTKSIIEQAFRDWIKGALTLTDAQVILGEIDGPRPALPYAAVTVLMFDRRVNVDDEQQASLIGITPRVRAKGQREASVSLQSFGAASSDWFPDARLALGLPAAQAIFDAANLTAIPRDASTFSTSQIDTSLEPRFLMEFDVAYAIESDYQTLDEAAKLIGTIDYDRYEGDADTLTDNFTASST